MLNLRKGQGLIFAANIVLILAFSVLFICKRNHEFLIYVAVIAFFLLLILATNRRVHYENTVLWGLTLWAAMHMAGGGITIGDKRLYEVMLIPVVGEPYMIFKYDQLVHIIGFGVATRLMYSLLQPSIGRARQISLLIVVCMAGLGVGAINEIVEFAATVLVPSTGVGGYENTSLDLASDLAGALIAVFFIRRGMKQPTSSRS